MSQKQAISEIQTLSESDKLIRCRERIEEMHIENGDWNAVLKDKWALLTLAQRS